MYKIVSQVLKQESFFDGNGLYAYKGDDLSQEELYLKMRLKSFVKDQGYPRGVNPQDETARKHLKRLIDSRLLMDACTREERKFFL